MFLGLETNWLHPTLLPPNNRPTKPTDAASSMHDNYLTAKAHYLDFLDRDIVERSGSQEAIRTTPLFSLSVKFAIDAHSSSRVYKAACRGTARASTTYTGRDELNETMSAQQTPTTNVVGNQKWHTEPVLPQYGLLGFNVGEHSRINEHEPIMMNVHAPNSAFICGSQGSGKSYTLNCMLENCLLLDQDIGQLQRPVAGLAFHYDTDSSGAIAETVHLCSRGIKVNVLVSNSNFDITERRYRAATDNAQSVTVQRFLLPPSELSIERMHKLMAFSERSDAIPLYMEVIQRILRQMAVAGHGRAFNYGDFLRHLESASLTNEQQRPMRLRLDLLQSFMQWPPTKADLKRSAPRELLELQPGSLTIVDLSDPFIDDATVCVLFDICLSLAKEKRPSCGLVIALDEAHKYMQQSPAASNFTTGLLTTIREQRHIGTRVIISTQEPTISEKLLDLCSITIVHHFKSPAWFQTIRNHLGAASSLLNSARSQTALFEDIMALDVGESRVFAPSAFVCTDGDGHPERLGSSILHMKTRSRLGVDGGVSVLAGEELDGMRSTGNA